MSTKPQPLLLMHLGCEENHHLPAWGYGRGSPACEARAALLLRPRARAGLPTPPPQFLPVWSSGPQRAWSVRLGGQAGSEGQALGQRSLGSSALAPFLAGGWKVPAELLELPSQGPEP